MSQKVLVIAAHPDDELLGPGATLARHAAEEDQCTIAIVADSGTARYEEDTIEAVRRCASKAARRVGVSDVRFGGLPDQRLDAVPILDITQWIEDVARTVQPQIIYTHHRGDINRDYQVVHKATLTAFRPPAAPFVERILCYETPSATEWAGPYVESSFVPNVYVNVSAHLDSKLKALSAYDTELRPFPHPRSLDALRVRASFWGSVIGVSAAEAFLLVREVRQ